MMESKAAASVRFCEIAVQGEQAYLFFLRRITEKMEGNKRGREAGPLLRN